MAVIGVRTIFKMMIFDNFVHADCHAGNILV
jgi:predicted unusual protein kinase regulating ubiquinone biosynthesis (AarF/ABC1/UbiB family)